MSFEMAPVDPLLTNMTASSSVALVHLRMICLKAEFEDIATKYIWPCNVTLRNIS